MRERLEAAAQEVHDRLGPGWSESIYHRALERELSERGVSFHSEGTIPVLYKGAPVGRRRPDLFVLGEDGETIIVELKSDSSSGWFQLEQYLDLTEASEDLGYIRGGALIQFNNELSVEFVELGPETNPDDSPDVNMIKELPTGVEIYVVSDDEHSVQVNYNPLSGDVEAEANALAEATDDDAMKRFCDRATDLVEDVTDG